jgi:hypothetical protein
MSQYENTYGIGSTVMAVGLSAAAVFFPPAFCNGGFFKIASGSGNLFLGNGISLTPGATMYPVSASEVVNFRGPSKFFFYATSATMLVGVGLSYNQGLSSPIAGG